MQIESQEEFPPQLLEELEGGANPLKALREYRGLTQRKLAEACGVPQQRIHTLEHKPVFNPTLKTLKALAQALRVSVGMLVK